MTKMTFVALMLTVLVMGCISAPAQEQPAEDQMPEPGPGPTDDQELRQEADTDVVLETRGRNAGDAEGCFSVVDFHYDAADLDHFNLNDEYVVLKNNCDFAIDMDGYRITEEGVNYLVQDFVLGPQATFTLYSGKGGETSTRLYWGSGTEVWDNQGDTLTIIDFKKIEVFKYTY
jgi:competence protein ComEC